jgi:hypothetical protein
MWLLTLSAACFAACCGFVQEERRAWTADIIARRDDMRSALEHNSGRTMLAGVQPQSVAAAYAVDTAPSVQQQQQQLSE